MTTKGAEMVWKRKVVFVPVYDKDDDELLRRIEHGRLAVELGTTDPEEDAEVAVTDTLANVMHLCARERVDFDRALGNAQLHFESETDHA